MSKRRKVRKLTIRRSDIGRRERKSEEGKKNNIQILDGTFKHTSVTNL